MFTINLPRCLNIIIDIITTYKPCYHITYTTTPSGPQITNNYTINDSKTITDSCSHWYVNQIDIHASYLTAYYYKTTRCKCLTKWRITRAIIHPSHGTCKPSSITPNTGKRDKINTWRKIMMPHPLPSVNLLRLVAIDSAFSFPPKLIVRLLGLRGACLPPSPIAGLRTRRSMVMKQVLSLKWRERLDQQRVGNSGGMLALAKK